MRGRVRTILITTLIAIAVGALFAVRTPGAQISPTAQSNMAPTLTLEQRIERSEFLASKLGLQFGVPEGARPNAIAQAEAARSAAIAASSVSALSSMTWSNIGPLPMTEAANFGGVILGSPLAMTGRVSAIAVDPANAANIAIGGANGGVWLSTDTGAHFAPVFDNEPSQAIGALAFDTTTSPSTLWAGTGEANNAIDTYYGQGLFKSTNLGASWTSVGSFDRAAFAKIAVDNSVSPARIFLALGSGVSSGRSDPFLSETDLTKQGLYRSTDDGATFSQYSASVFGCFDGPGPCPATDVAADGLLVAAAIGFDNVFISKDAGVTWAAASFPGLTLGPGTLDRTFRQSVAIQTASPVTIYAMVGDAGGVAYQGFFKSTDSGATWTAGTVPSATPGGAVTIDGTSTGNFSQSFYDQFLSASKVTAGAVAFGGVGPYLSTNSGATWTFLGTSGGIHSDQHAAALNPTETTLYIGNDGGAYAVNLGTLAITSLNTMLDLGQIQGIGPLPATGSKLIAGFQDNGTQIFSGTPAWSFAETGDGGFALFDQDPNFVYHTFASVGVPAISRSTNGGSTWSSSTPSFNLGNALNAASDRGANFYPPLASDPGTAHRVLFGAQFVYVSTDGMLTWTRQSTNDLTSGTCGSAFCDAGDVEFSPADHTKAWAVAMNDNGSGFEISNTMQANLNSGAVWTNQTVNFNLATVTGANVKTQITGVTPDPFNANTAYVTLSGFKASTGVGHVFKTTNFGATWSDVTGDLTDIPTLRLLVDNQDTTGNTLLAATDIGVFRSTNGGTNWVLFNQGVIPSVPIFDLEESLNGVIYAGSHGRGAYQLVAVASTPTPTPTPTPSTTPTGTPTPSTTPTPTRTPTVTPTATPSTVATPTPTPTPSTAPTATATPTPTPSTAPTATPTSTTTAKPTPIPSAPGAVATITASGTGGGGPGVTITGGSFSVTNTSAATETISSVSVNISDPKLFSSLTLTATFSGIAQSSGPITGAAIANPTVFTFSPALNVPPGQAANFALSTVISTTPALNDNPNRFLSGAVAYAAVVPEAANRGGSPLGGNALPLTGGAFFLGLSLLAARGSRRRTALIAVLTALALGLVACGGSGGGASVTAQLSSTQKIPAGGINITAGGAPQTVAGLPLTLGKITLN